MAEAPAVAKEFSAATKELGDKIAGLTLIQAKELADYLKDAPMGIEPAAGGANDDGMPAREQGRRKRLRSRPSSP